MRLRSFCIFILVLVTFCMMQGCGDSDSDGGNHHTTIPSAPGAPTVTPGDTQLTVTWDAVTDATSYEVYYSTTNDISTATLAGDSNSTDTTCTITGLSNDQTYYVWVKAKNSAGTSDASSVASGVPAPAAAWSGTATVGTSADDMAFCIAVGAGGKIYTGGSTRGSFPGYTNPNPGGIDGFITEMDSSGVALKNYQSQVSGDDYIRAMAVDSAGNIIVTGQGPSKCFVAKYKSDWTLLWSWDLGTSIWKTFGYAVTVDGNDNIYVAGRTDETINSQIPTGGIDAFVIKFNSSGVTQWTTFVGTASTDDAQGVVTDTSGNVYITGTTQGTFPGNTSAGGYDAFVAKLTNAGALVTVKQFGSTDSDYASSLAVDSANKAVWVTGTTAGKLASPTVGQQDYFLAKFNSDTLDNVLAKQTPTAGIDTGLAIALDAVGNVYIAGYAGGTLDVTEPFEPGVDNAFLIKCDVSGNVLWTRQLGSALGADYTAVAVSGTNIFVAGRTWGPTFDEKAVIGGIDAVVVKYNDLGVKQ